MRNKNASENNATKGDCMHSGRSTSNCGSTTSRNNTSDCNSTKSCNSTSGCGTTKSCNGTSNCGSTKNENRPLVKTSSESRTGEALKAQNAELTKTKCRAGCTARDKSEQMRREFDA